MDAALTEVSEDLMAEITGGQGWMIDPNGGDTAADEGGMIDPNG